MTIVVRTHGGLGNQIFQVLFARLCARTEKTDWTEVHDTKYKHRFDRSVEIAYAPSSITAIQRMISALRIPKFLFRLNCLRNERITLFGNIYLDGYFQKLSDYRSFTDSQIQSELRLLRKELSINLDDSKRNIIYHIRLGDFFTDPEKAKTHLMNRINDIAPESTIISNQEELFLADSIQDQLRAKSCYFHSTTDFTAEDVLRIMSKHKRIFSNNSTLAFWASVLGNCNSEFSDLRLAALHERFFRLAKI
jgi:hypothetical protein